jgi:hypothetical protein
MDIDPATFSVLTSTLGSSVTRDLFRTIVNRRIAAKAPLQAANPNADQELDALERADLISPAPNGEKYFVTAKGLKVARYLEQIPG